jgi:hypothetical protein
MATDTLDTLLSCYDKQKATGKYNQDEIQSLFDTLLAPQFVKMMHMNKGESETVKDQILYNFTIGILTGFNQGKLKINLLQDKTIKQLFRDGLELFKGLKLSDKQQDAFFANKIGLTFQSFVQLLSLLSNS